MYLALDETRQRTKTIRKIHIKVDIEKSEKFIYKQIEKGQKKSCDRRSDQPDLIINQL